MSDKKISELALSTSPLAGTEVLPIVQSGVTKKVSVADLTTGRAISATEATLTTGNLVIGTAGKGIDFSADGQAAGMTSELLDDYEEGTWTPVLTGSISGSITFSAIAYYTKIGNLVTVELYDSNIDATTALSGNVELTGLPFPASRTSPANFFFSNLFTTTNLYGAVSSSSLKFISNSNSTTLLTNTAVSAITGRRLAFSCTYRA